MTQEITKRHPIRGFIWGILFGLGLALIAIGQGYAALGTLPPLILLVVGIVLGTLWGLFAPSKKPKGEPPRQQVPVEAVGSSPPAPADAVPEVAAQADTSGERSDFAAPFVRTADDGDPSDRTSSLGDLASGATDDPQTPHQP